MALGLAIYLGLAVPAPASAQQDERYERGNHEPREGRHGRRHEPYRPHEPHGPGAPGDPDHSNDPLVPMLKRIDAYLQRNEREGVVLDARVSVNATEAIRLSVVSQLLGYTELYKVVPSVRVRQDITDRADYLIARFDQVRSGSVFDGMFGFALLEAYAATNEPRYLEYGRRVAVELEQMSPGERILNGGLMGAMALTRYFALTGDSTAREFVDDVMASLPAYQHANGSFPHWCACSTDIHYTDWMTTELILIARMTQRPDIAPMLARMRGFIASRIDAHGMTQYAEPCPEYPGCVIPYYSIATGCAIDYDTRAWTNELGYSALLFDGADSSAYARVMGFMGSLEHGGTFPDKWDFWPPQSDPYYVWTAADTSVVNTSLIFWSLTSTLSARPRSRDCGRLGRDEGLALLPVTDTGLPRAAAIVAPLSARPETGRGAKGLLHTVDRLLAAGSSPEQYCGASERAPAPPPGEGTGVDRRASLAGTNDPALRAGEAAAGLSLNMSSQGGTAGPVAIRFTLPSAGRTGLEVYDTAGRRVVSLLSEPLSAGTHRAQWDGRDAAGRDCPSGLYFLALRQGGQSRVARVSRLY